MAAKTICQSRNSIKYDPLSQNQRIKFWKVFLYSNQWGPKQLLDCRATSVKFTAIWQTSHDIGNEGCRRKHKTSFHAFSQCQHLASITLLHIQLLFVGVYFSAEPIVSDSVTLWLCLCSHWAVCIESHYWPHSLDSQSAPHAESGWPCHGALP